MKKIVIFIVTTLVLMVLCSQAAFASENVPFADSIFATASVSLSSNMDASYSATTRDNCSVIKVSSCSLQVKNGTVWRSAATLTAPDTSASNTRKFSASGSYANSCISGNTYRIKAVFDADGYTVTKYSNAVSY